MEVLSALGYSGDPVALTSSSGDPVALTLSLSKGDQCTNIASTGSA